MKKPLKLSGLKENQRVKIYTDFKEEKGYEGEAILLEKLYDGDTFYLQNESLLPGDKKEYSNNDYDMVHKFNRLKKFFYGKDSKGPTKYCKVLRDGLLNSFKKNKYDLMLKYLKEFRSKVKNNIVKHQSVKDLLNSFDDDYIINFIRQHNKVWQPSVYAYQRWKVKFVKDSAGWDSDFVTNRNIRVLMKWNPNDKCDNIIEYTSYNGLIIGENEPDEGDIPNSLIKDKDKHLDWIFPRTRNKTFKQIQDDLFKQFNINDEYSE